jgi:hypothetical protein
LHFAAEGDYRQPNQYVSDEAARHRYQEVARPPRRLGYGFHPGSVNVTELRSRCRKSPRAGR